MTDEVTKPDHYTAGYANASIHWEMLGDYTRTATYRDALRHPEVRDSIVLDIGAGTGILSMFAAAAGARHVVAIEMSNMADTAREIIARNGFADRITLIKAASDKADIEAALEPAFARDPSLREACLSPEGVFQCDVIVSEWMGYGLVFESMMDCVIEARDRWLRPNGLMLPAKCRVFAGLFTDAEGYERDLMRTRQWGFDYAPLLQLERKIAGVDRFAPESLATEPVVIAEWDMATATIEDFAAFRATALRMRARRQCMAHGLLIWFDCTFYSAGHPGPERIVAPADEDDFPIPASTGALILDTSPECPSTHWQQVYMPLDEPMPLYKNEAAELVSFEAVRKPEYFRAYVLRCTVGSAGKEVSMENVLE